MTSRYFNVPFSDLSHEAQEAIIDSLCESLQEMAEEEGKEFLGREWHDPKPKTWQEAYCRIYSINYQQWDDEVDEGEITTPPFMWEVWQEEHVRQMAEDKAHKSFKHTEIEVEL